MLKELISAVKGCYSGPAAAEHVASISQYHRIQASPGYRAAAAYCLKQLRAWGVDAEVLSFPADERTSYWTCNMFQEWEASEATLDLLLPGNGTRRLADYREDKISLIQRSLPFEGEAEIAVLEGGGQEVDYSGVDVAGKVVLAQGDVSEIYRLAVRERGAIGIIFDGMREQPPVRQRIDLPDARQYTSFWWQPGDERRCFGFVLTPRQGDELRAAARRQQERGEGGLRVRARVASRLYDGHIEVVSALIPGEGDQEVVLVAHLCHPQPSANDNASGAGALLEVAHTLHALIASGALKRPRRSIRLLWVPEMTGTYAYLATHEDEVPHMVAGLNLDMVGQSQGLCGSSFIIERPPEALASFAGDLLEALRTRMQEGAAPLSGVGEYPLYRQAVTPFSGGSDHYILSDPSVGVPTPMLIQWPDRFYHTSADTVDKVDPHMLAVVGGLAAAYAGFIAGAGEGEARWLAHEIGARARAALAREAQQCYTSAAEAGSPEELAAAARRAARGLAFRADRATAALRSLLRLAPGLGPTIESASHSVRAAGEREWLALQPELERLASGLGVEAIASAVPGAGDEWEQRAQAMVLRRLFRGPLSLPDLAPRLGQAERDALTALNRDHSSAVHALKDYMIYWLDGQRTLLEVADLVECETGQRDVAFMVQLAELLEGMGLLARVGTLQ